MTWVEVLRTGLMPLWRTDRLEAALELLEADDQRLLQGVTTSPSPAYQSNLDRLVDRCDVVAFCSTPDPFSMTVGEVEDAFAKAVYAAEVAVGREGVKTFLNDYDDGHRVLVWSALISEFRREIVLRSLSPELRDAVTRFSDDRTLLCAATDYLIGEGREREAEYLRTDNTN